MTTGTTVAGYVNNKNQQNLGSTSEPGTDHNSVLYRMRCLNEDCSYEYLANGTDIWQRKCPKCQGGKP